MEFSKQEYWSGLPFPISGDLPTLGTEPTSPATPTFGRGVFFLLLAPPAKHRVASFKQRQFEKDHNSSFQSTSIAHKTVALTKVAKDST